MEYRELGKTGMRVSVIGMGTWQFGGEWGKVFSQHEVKAMVRRAKELGINFIDTAECYGDHTSEELVGSAIHGEREKWIVATKFGHKFHGFMNRTDERSAGQMLEQLEGSLRALKTDYIDLYQYHSVRNTEYDNEELRAMLEKQLKAGKIRHVGASISPNDNMHQVQGAKGAHVETIQVVYNRLDRKAEEGVLSWCEREGLGVLARVPLASGYLSGKYRPGVEFAAGDVRQGHDKANRDAKLKEVEWIEKNELPAGANLAQWALAWCLRHPAVACVIPGCKNVEQVETNAKAVGSKR